MKSVKLTWTDPAAPLTGVELAMRVAGAPDFTVLSTVAPGVQTLDVPDLADGAYEFRAVALNLDKRSSGVTTTATVATPVATPSPSDVTNFTATVSS